MDTDEFIEYLSQRIKELEKKLSELEEIRIVDPEKFRLLRSC